MSVPYVTISRRGRDSVPSVDADVPAIFSAFLVSHLVGDFLLQTEWQALGKHGGNGATRYHYRALAGHIATYTLAFAPVLAWLAAEGLSSSVLLVAVLIALPHALVDDGRAVMFWMRHVKHTEPQPGALLIAVDQSAHAVMLFATAIVAGALV